MSSCMTVDGWQGVPAGWVCCGTRWPGPRLSQPPAHGSGCWRGRRRHPPRWRPPTWSPRTSYWRWSSPAGWPAPVFGEEGGMLSQKSDMGGPQHLISHAAVLTGWYLFQGRLHVQVVGQAVSGHYKVGSGLEPLLELQVKAPQIVQTSRQILKEREQENELNAK